MVEAAMAIMRVVEVGLEVLTKVAFVTSIILSALTLNIN